MARVAPVAAMQKGRVADARLMRDYELPALAECLHFVNLTNGLEAVPHLRWLGLPYFFTRIQSTYCEQQRFDDLIIELDPNLLMSLAVGNCCLVWDFGSRNKKRGVPRSIWYGLEFIRYAATQIWLADAVQDPPEAYLRGNRVSSQFDQIILNFSKTAKNKMRYYRKFVPSGVKAIQLYGVYDSTVHDPDLHVYQAIVSSYMGPKARADDPYIVPELSTYLQPRLTETMDSEKILWGDSFRALNTLGFDIYLGGQCHSTHDPDDF